MIKTTRLVPIGAYKDDGGKPVCGACPLWGTHGFFCKGWAENESDCTPGPDCPVWKEQESLWQPITHLLRLMEALEIPHPEWWLAKPPEFLAECGKAITAQAKQASPPKEKP